MPFTFIHTGDWQLGLKLTYIPGDAGAQARLLRHQAVRAIADLAHTRNVDAILVSGDVLDSNAAGPETLQRAREALASFAPTPVFLIPGNHDHAGPACALGRLVDGLPHVQLLDQRTAVPIAGATIYPCPLLRRHEVDDPTTWLPSRASEDGIRIAMAHGGVIDFAALSGDDLESPNLIDIQGALAKGFDYVALGDWHGTLTVDRRAWYSGTPEPTRFKEKNPGGVLVVRIAAPGSEPEVERIQIATTTWQRWDEVLTDDAAIDGLEGKPPITPRRQFNPTPHPDGHVHHDRPVQSAPPKQRVTRTDEEAAALVMAWEASGQGPAIWCRTMGIPRAALHSCRLRMQSRSVSGGFLPVLPAETGGGLALGLPEGIRISGVTVQEAAELILALRKSP